MIKVHKATPKLLTELGVEGWATWECAPETFPWEYSDNETAYVKEGKVTVVTEEGQEVHFGAGDLVFFPSGLRCTWTVHETIRKVYSFGGPPPF